MKLFKLLGPLACVILLASFIASPLPTAQNAIMATASAAAPGVVAQQPYYPPASTLDQASGSVKIGPGETYAIKIENGMLEPEELPTVELPDVAYQALDKVPEWIRPKLLRTFMDLTKGMINVGSRSKPALGDINGDGLLDIVIGTSTGELICYINTGTPRHLQLTRNDTFVQGVAVGNYSAPFLADLNNDGLLDLIVGCGDGRLYFWWNNGTAQMPSWVAAHEVFDGIDVGNYSVPALVDLNNDGLLDLVVGSEEGVIYFWWNTGTADEPEWTPDPNVFPVGYNDYMGWYGMYVGTNTAPAFADIDGDGDLDLIVGESGGYLHVYRNSGTPEEPMWSSVPWMLSEVYLFGYTTPALGDLDGDGLVDLVIGSEDGYVYWIRNLGTPSEPDFRVWRSGIDEVCQKPFYELKWWWDYFYTSWLTGYPRYGYFPDVDILTAVNEPGTDKYIEALADLILSVNESYVDEIAYMIANDQMLNLKVMVDYGLLDDMVLNVHTIYNTSVILPYVRIKEGPDYTTIEFRRADGSWVEVPKEIYYQRLVMFNRYIYHPWYRIRDIYEGKWFRTHMLFDPRYNVTLYDVVKDAQTPYEAAWRIHNWSWYQIKARWDCWGTWRARGWWQIWTNLNDNPDDSVIIMCGEFSIITQVWLRAVLIPAANTINLGEDHQWAEFFAEDLKWHHIDTTGPPSDQPATPGKYFDNPTLYEVGWHKNVSSVFWWEQGGRYDHVISRTEVTGYTNTSLVIFEVYDAAGRPIDGARVEAWGHWIIRLYEVPLLSYLNYTDMYGRCSMYLGGMNYTFLILTRIGYQEITAWIEEGRTYVFKIYMDRELPSKPEVTVRTDHLFSPYRLNLEFSIAKGEIVAPHWIGFYAWIRLWEDIWTFGPEATYIDVYVMDEENFYKFLAGLPFEALYAAEGVSSGSITDLTVYEDRPVYVVFSNRGSVATYLYIDYRAELVEDRTPPTVTIISPADGAIVGTSDVTIEFSSPDPDVHHFEISIDGAPWVVATSPYTARGLREGTHTVRVRAIDISGNIGEASVTFTVDTKAPVVVITSPSNGSSVYGKVKITWFIDEPNVLNVTLEVAGKKIDATGLTSYTWDTTGLPDGYYTIRLTVIDKLGRTTTAEVTVKTINEALRAGEARVSALKGGLVGGVIVAFLVGFLPTYFILRKRA